jgi:hypothetical protein
VRSGQRVGRPWSALAAQALPAAGSAQPVQWGRLWAAVVQSEAQGVAAPLVQPEPRIEAVQAALEP